MLRRTLASALLLISALLVAGPTGGCPSVAPADNDGLETIHHFKFDPTTSEYVVNGQRVAEADVQRDLPGQLCGQCHADQVQEVKQSMHYLWQGKNPNVLFPGGGAHGMIDRACALPATTALINYTNDPQLDECAKCHVGRYLPVMEGAFSSMFQQMGLPNARTQASNLVTSGLDCLICHASVYSDVPEGAAIVAGNASGALSPATTGFARSAHDNGDFDGDGQPDPVLDMNGDGQPDAPLMMDTNGDGQPDTPWPTVAQDRSHEAVASVGATSDHSCLRCHEHARTGYKRGTPFLPGYDVHAGSAAVAELGGGEDRHCVACHTVAHHKFRRGDLVGGDVFASDYAIGSADNELSCESCHPRDTLRGMPHYAWHLDKLSCETCHIPTASGITYSLFGQGGQIAFGRNDQGMDTKVITLDHMINQGTDADTAADWAAYRTYPTLMWYNGQVSFLAQSLAVPSSPNAKITPFKPMGNGMVFDARFFDGEMVNNAAMGGQYAYNAYSMYRFFANGANADVFAALNMLDLTPDEVRNITLNDFISPDVNRQAMAMMQIFPNLVYFDKTVFGYEHYLIGMNTPWDANRNGLIDASQPFFFDIYAASNAGLRDFQGFNAPMGLPADYEWYPSFTDLSQTISMKLPDGTLMKMFLALQGMQLPADQQQAYMASFANYPAYSNGITLGGHGVRPKEEALGYGTTCNACHDAGGIMDHLVPVTKTEPRDVPGFGTFELPVYRWRYYNLHQLVDLGIRTSDADIVAGTANVDVAGNTTYIRESSLPILINYMNPAGEGSYRRADTADALSGTGLAAQDLTWQHGEWMPVLEPDVRYAHNYEVLGYGRRNMLFMER